MFLYAPGKMMTSKSASVNENRLMQCCQQQHKSARADSWRIWEILHGTYALWSGYAVVQRWARSSSYEGNILAESDSFAIALRLYRCGFDKGVSIGLVVNRCRRLPNYFSMQWNFSFPNIIPRTSDIFRYLQDGNVAAVKSTFQMGRASPRDIMLDGTSLLHVITRLHLSPSRHLICFADYFTDCS